MVSSALVLIMVLVVQVECLRLQLYDEPDSQSLEFHRHVRNSATVIRRQLRAPDEVDDSGSAARSAVLDGCGEICDTSASGSTDGKFPSLRKSVDCHGLFSNAHSDAAASSWPPPRDFPPAMLQDFTMNGAAVKDSWYLESRYSGGNAATPVWSKSLIDNNVAQAKAGTLTGTYGKKQTKRLQHLLQRHAEELKGKRLFVIGSENPWLEALLLEAGAQHVTTIEYGKIRSEDPRVSTITPAEVRQMFLESNGTEPQFDGGATYSSIEHSGLGRYGDTFNPWGDLQAVAKAWCITKPQGLMFMGVPHGEKDKVHYNAHRVYGPKRFPHLMTNWIHVGNEDDLLQGKREGQYAYAFRRQNL